MELLPREEEQDSLGEGGLLGCSLAPWLPASVAPRDLTAGPPKAASVYFAAVPSATLINPSQ